MGSVSGENNSWNNLLNILEKYGKPLVQIMATSSLNYTSSNADKDFEYMKMLRVMMKRAGPAANFQLCPL